MQRVKISKTTIFSLVYLFLGAVAFNIIFIISQINSLNIKTKMYAELLSKQILVYAQKQKSINESEIIKYLSTLIENQNEYYVVLLTEKDNKVVYTNIVNPNIVKDVVYSIKTHNLSQLSSNYIYYISYIPSRFEELQQYDISLENRNTTRYILVSLIPINKIFENKIFIFVTSYFAFYVLFLIYSVFHIRNYEKKDNNENELKG